MEAGLASKKDGAARPRGRRRRLIAWSVGGAGLLGLLLFGGPIDRAAYEHAVIDRVRREDWWWLLRLCGDLRTWAIVAMAFVLVDRGGRVPLRRSLLLLCSAGLAGLLAELGKLLVRRERPGANDGLYAFRSWAEDPLSTSGLGLPSSHTAVAFGAGMMLVHLHPKGWALWIALGAGCAASRVVDQAHFVTDVLGGAAVGCAAAGLMRLADGDRRREGAAG